MTTKAVPSGILIDANGKKIGHYYPVNSTSGMVLTYVGGQTLFMGVARTWESATFYPFRIEDHVDIYYESTDCTGPAYVWGGTFATTVNHGNGLWKVYLAGSPRTVNYNSYRQGLGDCLSFQSGAQPLAPVTAEVDLSTEYAPPYTLR